MSQILLTDVRSKFLDYFKKNNHQIVESSNLVPNNDPTLMFTNSGMVQFKNIFTGLEKKTFKTVKPLQWRFRSRLMSQTSTCVRCKFRFTFRISVQVIDD